MYISNNATAKQRSTDGCYCNNEIKCYIVLDLGHSSNQILSILNEGYHGFPQFQCNKSNISFSHHA
jgi:hypothetical protein